MANVKVIYGSSTGNTESAAAVIAGAFGTEAINITNAKPEDFEAGLLILGSSTWGLGELQDDWATGIAMLDGIDLTGRKVAVFGLGDQSGFGDTFVDAMGILADKAKERGAVLVGETSAEGYAHTASSAEKDGKFCGLALDDNNEPDKTADRISQWVGLLKQASA